MLYDFGSLNIMIKASKEKNSGIVMESDPAQNDYTNKDIG